MIKKKVISFLFFFVLIVTIVFSQQNKIDSLHLLLQNAKEDTSKIQSLLSLADEYSYLNPDSAILYSSLAKQFSEKIKDSVRLAKAIGELGWDYYVNGNYARAIENYFLALKIDEGLKNKKGMAARFSNLGIVYMSQGNYPQALDYYFKALKIKEELGNKYEIAITLCSIGNFYKEKSDYPLALDYYFRALKMDEDLGNKNGIAADLGNIGNVYEEQNDLSLALDYYLRALKIAEELGYKQSQANNLGNLGNVYHVLATKETRVFQSDSLFSKALDYYFRALKVDEELGNDNGIARHFSNIGSLYTKQKQYKKAEDYLFDALKISKAIGAQNFERQVEELLSDLYTKSNRHQLALDHYKKAMVLKDTLFNQEKDKDITRKEMNFEFEKKEAATQAEHDKHLAVSEAEKKKQQIIIWSVVAGLLLVALILIIVVQSLRVTKRQKSVIEKQKETVEEQRKTVEEKNIEISHKNKELTDSINYAQRIQSAILTSEQYLNEMFLPEGQTASHFILYKPKDIVAGDFYWAYKTHSGKAIWVAADCTGHGVPGAFMSMIGNSLLNEIVLEKGIDEPDEILNQLRAGVIKSLGQGVSNDDKRKDGMDAAICVWDKVNNQLTFSGANNCLWIIRKELPGIQYSVIGKKENENDATNTEYRIPITFIEIAPDSQPVGQHLVMKPFTKREIQLQPGDTLYTFTDGYCDQFGGPKGKKFKYKPFKELLLFIQDRSMPGQKEIINRTIEDWKGNMEQVDDICVFGVRL